MFCWRCKSLKSVHKWIASFWYYYYYPFKNSWALQVFADITQTGVNSAFISGCFQPRINTLLARWWVFIWLTVPSLTHWCFIALSGQQLSSLANRKKIHQVLTTKAETQWVQLDVGLFAIKRNRVRFCFFNDVQVKSAGLLFLYCLKTHWTNYKAHQSLRNDAGGKSGCFSFWILNRWEEKKLHAANRTKMHIHVCLHKNFEYILGHVIDTISDFKHIIIVT